MENTVANSNTPEKYEFKLFVSGMSVKSGHAIENIRRIAEKHLSGNFNLEIIDVSRDRHSAVEYQIIAIPTLIRINPGPRKVLLGDLSNTERVLRALNIKNGSGE